HFLSISHTASHIHTHTHTTPLAYTSRAQPSADVPSRAEHSNDADEAEPSHRLLSSHAHRLFLPSTHTHQLSLPHHKILSHSLPLPPPYPFIFPHHTHTHTHTHTHSDFAWHRWIATLCTLALVTKCNSFGKSPKLIIQRKSNRVGTNCKLCVRAEYKLD
ncbi:hypothetical protein ACB092_04G212400, partial [Castanea dentata]